MTRAISKAMKFAAPILAATLCVGAAQAQTKVTLVQMHPAIGIGEEVFLYAVPKRLGYFKSEGLEVAVEGVMGGGASAQMLQTGRAQFATTVPESILQAREQGGDPIGFYTLKRHTGTMMVVREDSPIRKLEDLKGATVGAASFGAGGGLAVKDYLARAGIGAADFSAVTTGVNPAAFAALQSKQIDALVLWDAMRGAAENTGLKLRVVEVPGQDQIGAMTLATTERFLKENPAAVKGMCRAVAKGLRFTLSNLDAAIRIFWEEFPTAKPSGLDDATALRNHRHIMTRWFETSLQGVEKGKETGEIPTQAWRRTQEVYTGSGMIKNTKPVETAYTTELTADCNAYDRGAIETAAANYK